jgi:hypothetical protein
MLKIPGIFFFLMLTSMLLPSSGYAQSVLDNPTDDILCLLYYHFANQPPPIDQFAQNAPSVTNSNEFDKAQALSDEKARLQALYNALATVKLIRVNINMSLGTYDTQNGEYDLSGFSGNDYISYNCFDGTSLQLEFNNSDYAQSWTLSESAAQDVLDRNGGSRDVVAISTISLTGINPGAPGDPLVLQGDVKEVTVKGEYNNAPLGHYVVPNQ